MFSPRFRSVAEMAGWDEETLLIASLVVEDTPDRQIKNKRRTNLHFKTPPTNSRSKRRAQRRGPAPIPVAVLNLDSDDESSKQASEKEKKEESDKNENIDKKMGDTESEKLESGGSALPCMERLREELSCAICLLSIELLKFVGTEKLQLLPFAKSIKFLQMNMKLNHNGKLAMTAICSVHICSWQTLEQTLDSECQECPAMSYSRKLRCLEEGAQMFILKPLKQSDVKKLRGQLMKCGS